MHIKRQDFSEVYPSDIPYVEHILRDIELFEPVDVGLAYVIRHIGGNYDCNISGWRSGFSMALFYQQFLRSKRDAKYAYISENAAEICPATMELTVHIRARAVTVAEDVDVEESLHTNIKAYAENKLNRLHYVQENVNDAELDPKDKQYVEPTLCDVLLMDPSLNAVKILIRRFDDTYNCLFSNWQNPIRIKKFYFRFLNTAGGTRDSKFSNVLPDAEVTPAQEGEGGPYLIVRIRARAIAETDYKRRV